MTLQKKQLLSRLHFFIFGATIVGENAISSLVVASFGSSILGNLFFVNSVILFALPLFFFQKIDKANRGFLLKKVLKIAPIIIASLFLVYELLDITGFEYSKVILLILYPISYLLKTVLFLTFWIIAADLAEPSETKSLFPSVASFGFVGGLTGALIATVLLSFIKADFLILFWALIYIAAYVFVNHIVTEYNDKLIPKEVLPSSSTKKISSLLADTKVVLENVLVRYIAILHYGIFISIFLVDFHFWQQCNDVFRDANSLSFFNNSYYIIHSLITIGVLHYITPDLIATRGFTRIFSYLPITLFTGSVLYFAIVQIFGGTTITFGVLLIWQVFRYIAFENFFSPIYQMFFAAVEKEKRGRAKTVIEGLVKPFAMMSASLVIMLIGKNSNLVIITISIASFLLVLAALKIKHAYMKSMISDSSSGSEEMQTIIANIGSESEKECISILQEFALFSSTDMKRLAIKLLVRMHRRESTAALQELVYEKENVSLVREAARYAGEISHSTPLIEFLVTHKDPVVWHRAVLSLVHHNTHLNEYREHLFRYFFSQEESPEDQVHAGVYIWKKGSKGDRRWIHALLKNLLQSDSIEKKQLGILGVVILRIDNWDDIAVRHVVRVSDDIRKVIVRAVIDDGSTKTQLRLLTNISLEQNEKCNEILMREIYRQPEKCIDSVDQFIVESKSLSIFCHRLIKALGALRLGSHKKDHFELKGIYSFAHNRLKEVYGWVTAYHTFQTENESDRSEADEIMDIALHERLYYAAEIALDTLVLIDESGFIGEGRRELRVREEQERMAIVELLEASKDSELKDLTIPILEDFPWSVYHDIALERFEMKYTLAGVFRSTNPFLQMTALYWCAKIGREQVIKLDLEREVRNLALSVNNTVQQMSQSLLQMWEKNMSEDTKAFTVLRRVLVLKKSELFSSVTAARLVRLAEGVHEIEYAEGDMISREGDRANHLYLMKEGRADIISGSGESSVKIAELVSGDSYGEIGLFNQDIRSASVIATKQSTVYVLSRSYLQKMVAQIPELANTFLSVFGRKLQQSHEDFIRLQQTIVTQEKR